MCCGSDSIGVESTERDHKSKKIDQTSYPYPVKRCPICNSCDWHFRKNLSNPVFIEVKIIILSVSAIIQRKEPVIKCKRCGFELVIPGRRSATINSVGVY